MMPESLIPVIVFAASALLIQIGHFLGGQWVNLLPQMRGRARTATQVIARTGTTATLVLFGSLILEAPVTASGIIVAMCVTGLGQYLVGRRAPVPGVVPLGARTGAAVDHHSGQTFHPEEDEPFHLGDEKWNQLWSVLAAMIIALAA